MKKPVPTLAEVAKVAGVSQMTASRAINNRSGVSKEKREDIQRIADEMGYVVNRAAQRLSGGRTRVIGVMAQLHTTFTAELVLGAGGAARAAGYEMLVYSLPDNDRRPPGSVVDLLRQIADGVIALLPYESDYLETLSAAHLPVITVDYRGEESPFPSVASDSYEGGRTAVRHLAELGHRRIAHITGNERLASARDRRRAYLDTMAQLGLAIDPAQIATGDFSQRSGFEAANRLLALNPRPTAIFAANDISALGAISAIRDAGLRVPEDLSVVGFDDIPVAAQLHPPLTTIRQPMQQMGRSAVNMLLALIVGLEAPSPRITLPTQLIVRGSTVPPTARLRS
ncbi:MAG: LacI family DNA-binding transcriptional regulator [Azospirillaceae bacterium]|nr:LacI family DNA-binding transcriptional regulator [Azospirillaceae bacterium]